jgi:putative transposase
VEYDHREKLQMIEPHSLFLNISRQTELLELSRSSYYYRPYVDEGKQEKEKQLLNMVNTIYTTYPFLGSRRMKVTLRKQ